MVSRPVAFKMIEGTRRGKNTDLVQVVYENAQRRCRERRVRLKTLVDQLDMPPGTEMFAERALRTTLFRGWVRLDDIQSFSKYWVYSDTQPIGSVLHIHYDNSGTLVDVRITTSDGSAIRHWKTHTTKPYEAPYAVLEDPDLRWLEWIDYTPRYPRAEE